MKKINEILISHSKHQGYHYELLKNPPKKIIFKQSIPPLRIKSKEFIFYDYEGNNKKPMHCYYYPIIYNGPFIIDIDHIYHPWLIDDNYFFNITLGKMPHPPNDNISKERLNLSKKIFSSKNCKQILPWSKWCEKTIRSYFKTDKINNKITQIYPAVKNIKFRKEKKNSIDLLFISDCFERKGGLQLIDSYKKIKNKYDINLTIVTKYLNYSSKKLLDKLNIDLFSHLDKNNLFRLYKLSDIFVLPTLLDSFGIVLLEAMNFKLPIITTYGNGAPAMNEIVENEKNGFLIDLINKKNVPFFQEIPQKELIEKIKLLIEDDSLRRKMGNRGKKEIEEGKFCIQKRNKKLLKIYNKCFNF